MKKKITIQKIKKRRRRKIKKKWLFPLVISGQIFAGL
jgi:hypothetical protein